VYVRPFPSGPGKWKISSGNGHEPRWRRDSKELFYLVTAGSRQTLQAVHVQGGPAGTFEIGQSEKLFDFSASYFTPQINVFLYSPSSDGQRFLVSAEARTTEPTLNVLVNWEKAAAKD